MLAVNAEQFAINTPGAWNLGNDPNRTMKGYTYTDRPVYRPGDTVHFKTIVRAQTASGYTIPQGQELSLQMRDPQTYEVMWTQTVKLSDMGTAYWNYAIPADAKLGSYYLSMQMGERYVEGTNFSVEEYKKPEYCGESYGADAARAARPAHQGDHRCALLFRRAGREREGQVGGAHLDLLADGARRRRRSGRTARRGEGDNGDADGRRRTAAIRNRRQSGTLDADGKLQITVPTRVDSKHQDLVYRIEARVTDAGNREIAGHGYALATYGSFYPDGRADLLRLQQGRAPRPSLSPRRTTTRSRCRLRSAWR